MANVSVTTANERRGRFSNIRRTRFLTLFQLWALSNDLLVRMENFRCTARFFRQTKNRFGNRTKFVDENSLNWNIRLHMKIS